MRSSTDARAAASSVAAPAALAFIHACIGQSGRGFFPQVGSPLGAVVATDAVAAAAVVAGAPAGGFLAAPGFAGAAAVLAGGAGSTFAVGSVFGAAAPRASPFTKVATTYWRSWSSSSAE